MKANVKPQRPQSRGLAAVWQARLAMLVMINVAQLWAQFESDIRTDACSVPDFDVAVRLTRLLDGVDTASHEGRTISLED